MKASINPSNGPSGAANRRGSGKRNPLLGLTVVIGVHDAGTGRGAVFTLESPSPRSDHSHA
ncbi:MAG: hypothetical protein HYR88_03015 [Verrucomicrobia bacterium]|nr:hypothetical protein [Verrucomicrobiota bacterium]MBI3868399.1 hypothetical protein [Verrucomicrobiota bacterium]